MLPYRVICSCSLSSDHLLLVTCQHVVDRRRSSLARIRSHDRDCLIEGITRDASSVTAAPGLEQCYGIGLAVRIPDAVYTSEGTSPGVAVAVALLLVVAIAYLLGIPGYLSFHLYGGLYPTGRRIIVLRNRPHTCPPHRGNPSLCGLIRDFTESRYRLRSRSLISHMGWDRPYSRMPSLALLSMCTLWLQV